MRLTWLGWAGVEVESEGRTAVVDPLRDAAAVFAGVAVEGREVSLPDVTDAQAGRAAVGLVTHLHRDHADAAALAGALAAGAPLLEPPAADGDGAENLALAQAEHELAALDAARTRMAPWESVVAGPFRITALPAADGIGDPQVSWLIESGDGRVLHLGDTCWHGQWWRIASRVGRVDAVFVPVNGAVVSFPHRQPAVPIPVAMGPDAAAAAVSVIDATLAIPIHGEGYSVPGVYEPVPDAVARFERAARERGVATHSMQLGETLDV